MSATDPARSVVAFFEALTPAGLARIDELYAAQAHFKDPFNEVRGPAAIRRIFEHMFEALDSPRFRVHECVSEGAQAFLVWDFEFALRRGSPRGPQRIRGCTHLRFDSRGRIVLHRDYWDAAQELYAKLPLVGALMRWLARRAGGG